MVPEKKACATDPHYFEIPYSFNRNLSRDCGGYVYGGYRSTFCASGL